MHDLTPFNSKITTTGTHRNTPVEHQFLKRQGYLVRRATHHETLMPMAKLGAWLKNIQQHFIEGRNCDVVVRVAIEQPPAKRAGRGGRRGYRYGR